MGDLAVIQREQELAELISRFHREQQGHQPATCTAHVLAEMAIVRSTGVFTPTEQTLSGSTEGRKLIQSARREQRALTRRDVESQVAKLLNRRIVRSYYDLDVRDGEQIEVYIFE
ncbi:MAG TPA: DUF2294 domain-containing protein [Fimbriimonas sp.]|nr:DUF2294 domain-containing protein [Fimbriimonas sp.]